MNDLDVLIVGGGAAGLSAALVLLRARRSVVVIDAGAPRNAPASQMHGYLSRDGAPPGSLLEAGRQEVEGYGGIIIAGTVASVATGFAVGLTDGREFRARRVLVSTGLRDEIPAIPGMAERWGRDLLHCPYCHGYEVSDEPLGVFGGNAESVAHALLIAQWSDDVIYFPHTYSLSDDERELLAARGVGVTPGHVSRLVVEADRLQSVEFTDGTRVPRSALFIRPAMRANDTLLADLRCERDARGWVRRDASGQTTVRGVYVAGNAADPRAQVITAAGQGSATAIAINADLVDEDLAVRVAAHRDS